MPLTQEQHDLIDNFKFDDTDIYQEAIDRIEGKNLATIGGDSNVAKERGLLGDIASNMARGVADAVRMGGYAIKTLDPDGGMNFVENIGQSLVDVADKSNSWEFFKPDESEAAGTESYVKRMIMGGIRSIPITGVGMAAGYAASISLPVSAVTAGTLATLGLFGLGTYGEKEHEYLNAGLSAEEANSAAIKQGLIEGGLEAVATYTGLKIFGVDKFLTQPLKHTIKELLETPVSTFAKNMAKETFFNEIPTEMLQSALGTAVETNIGLQEEGAWKQAAIDSIIPAMVVSSFFGSAAQGMTYMQRRTLKNDLNDLENPDKRFKAVETIEKGIANSDDAADGQEFDHAEKFSKMAIAKIEAGEEIDLLQDFIDYAAMSPDKRKNLATEIKTNNINAELNRNLERQKNLNKFGENKTPEQEQKLKNLQKEQEVLEANLEKVAAEFTDEELDVHLTEQEEALPREEQQDNTLVISQDEANGIEKEQLRKKIENLEETVSSKDAPQASKDSLKAAQDRLAELSAPVDNSLSSEKTDISEEETPPSNVTENVITDSPTQDDLHKNIPKNTIVGGTKEIGQLYSDVMLKKIPGNQKKAIRFQVVDQKEAQSLKEHTGLELKGFKHTVDSFGILHTNKQHGDEKKESLRGQRAITKEDFKKIPDIINNYDTVEYAGKDKADNDVIKYIKKYNGDTYYVEAVKTGRHQLISQSMWVKHTAKNVADSKSSFLTSKNDSSITHKDNNKSIPTKTDSVNKKANEILENEDIKITGDKENTTVKTDIPVKEANALKPKEQKAYLLKEIDSAIQVAPTDNSFKIDKKAINRLQTNILTAEATKDEKKIKELKQEWKDLHAPYDNAKKITIQVPGDGEFTLLNNKESLTQFKKKMKGFPASNIIKISSVKGSSTPNFKPSNKRVRQFAGEYLKTYSPKKTPNRLPELSTSEKYAGGYGDGFYTNNQFAVKISKPKTKRPIQDMSDPIKRLLKDKRTPAVIEKEFYKNPSGEKGNGYLTVNVKSKGKYFKYNPEYLDVILKKYPKAKPYVNNSGVLVFEFNNKPVGFVAQMTRDQTGQYKDISNGVDKPVGYDVIQQVEENAEKKSEEFVLDNKGNIDFGEISKPVADIIGRQSGKIRLQMGNEKFGKVHIEKSHLKEFKKQGFSNIEDFVSQVTSKFNEIRRGGKGTLILAKRNGNNQIAYVELEPAKDNSDFYTVKSATFSPDRYLNNKELLWEGAPSLHSITGTPNAISGKSNSKNKIPPNPNSVNKKAKEVLENSEIGQRAKEQYKGHKKADDTPIEDFGEKIGGARKDYASTMQKGKELETAKNPLSKTFPEPKYQKLIDDGGDPYTIGAIRAMRDEIPSKPKAAWKLRRWIEQVEMLRDLSEELLTGHLPVNLFKEKIKESQNLYGNIAGRAELYERFGHDKSLKGIKMSKEHWGLYKGKKNVTKWQIARKGRKSFLSNMPDLLGEGDTKEQAIADFAKKYEAFKNEGKGTKKTKFNVYQYRATPGTHWIGKKVGREYIDLKSFKTSQEANEYLKNNYDKLVEQLKKEKYIPDVRRKQNEERIGEDHRKGKDVTPEKFTETFNFRGVEFGNWLRKKNERQNALNNAYDALIDLSEILNIPTQAISLNGELGLAFGARGKGGKGAAAAHYEPGKVVINLTRKEGAGSLAHEWWHSLDNYFSRLRKQPGLMLSEHPYKRTTNPNDEIRQEMIDAFKAIQDAYSATGIRKRSLKLDQKRTKVYWSTKTEITARIFETYIISELAKKGYSNDYLANIVSDNEFTTDLLENMGDPDFKAIDYYPYLTKKEQAGVSKAFDNFFSEIKIKKTDKGTALYQTADSKQTLPLVAKLTGEEIQGRPGNELFENARIYYQQKLQRGIKTVDRKGLGSVRITGIGWDKTKRGLKTDPLKVKLIPAIPDIIKYGEIEPGKEASKTSKVSKYYHITANVEIDNKIYQAGVTIGKDRHGNFYYNINHDTALLLKRKKAYNLPRIEAGGGKPLSEDSTSSSLNIETLTEPVKKNFSTNITPGQGVTLADIQKQFKNQNVFISPDGSISVRFKNGQGTVIKTVKQISDGDYQFAIESGQMNNKGVILGKTEGSTITLDENLSDLATLRHETKHLLDNLGIITRQDNNVLWNEFLRIRNKESFGYESSTHKNKQIAKQENLANTFAHILQERDQYRGTRLGKIIQKVMDFFDALLHVGRQSVRKLAREVESGKIYSRKTSNQNIKDGLKAMQEVIKKNTDVKDAMYRKDIGSISFYWGTPGNPKKNFKGGYGVSHILAKRESENQIGELTALSMVGVLDKGNVKRVWGPQNGQRVEISYKNNTAILSLSKDGKKDSWLLTGWQNKKNPDESGEVYDSAESTHERATRFHSDMGAGFIKNIPTESDSVKKNFSTAPNISTQAFKKWFGKSIARSKGKPITFLHGTPNDFTVFKSDKSGQQTGHPSAGLGFFFTQQQSKARNYAQTAERNGNIMKVYLKVQNPYQMTLEEFQSFETVQESTQLKNKLKAKGHDSVMIPAKFTGDKEPIVIVFESEQVKSIHNQGTFDSNNPDIRYQTSKDRKYTPGQQAYKKAGGFGQKKKETFKEKFDQIKVRAGDKMRQGIVDQFHSLNKVLGDKKAWMLAHLTKSDTGVLMTAINEGMPVLDKSGAVDIKEDSKSLKEILAPLGNELDDFLAWIAANRSEKLMAEDRENLFTPEQIAAGKTLNKGRETLYDNVRKEFEELGAAITDIAVKTDLVNEKEAQQWKEEGFYVPFYRMLEEQENVRRGPGNINGLTNQKAYKKLKGGKSQLDDLLTNTLLNWNHLISAGLRNQAGKKALESAENMGLATVVPKEIKSKDAVYIRENGQEVWYELDETPEGQLVLDSILSLSYEGLNTPAMKTMRAFKRVLTQGVTASPGFKIRNLIRDSLHAPAVTTASKNPLKNIAIGFKHKKDMKRMEAGGGAFSQEGYIHGNDPDAMKRLVGVASNSILNTPNKIAAMWRAYENFGNTLENINRVASFKNDLAKGKSLLEANFNARDQLDFSRSGSFSSVRMLTQTIPFLNARMQGLDKISRGVMDKTQRKQFAQVVGAYTIASVSLMLAMSDDEDYNEAPEWEKRTYHLFKVPGVDKMYRLPRPFEVGAIAYMTEQMTKQFVDENAKGKDMADALYHTLSDTFAISIVPQAFKPMLEVYSNKDSFRNTPIESMSMQRLSKKERSKSWTSNVAKGASSAMSKVLPEGATLSPVQIQHLVRAYTGWVGATTLASMDFLIKKMSGEITPETKISEYTWNPVSSFVRDSDAKSSKYVTRFYDNMAELNKMWADIRKYRGTPGGIRVTAEQKKKLRYRKTYAKVSKTLSALRKQEEYIYKNTSMSSARKRLQLKRIRKVKNNLTKKVIMFSKDVF